MPSPIRPKATKRGKSFHRSYHPDEPDVKVVIRDDGEDAAPSTAIPEAPPTAMTEEDQFWVYGGDESSSAGRGGNYMTFGSLPID